MEVVSQAFLLNRWWAVTQRTSINHRTANLGGGGLHGNGNLLGTIQSIKDLVWHFEKRGYHELDG